MRRADDADSRGDSPVRGLHRLPNRKGESLGQGSALGMVCSSLGCSVTTLAGRELFRSSARELSPQCQASQFPPSLAKWTSTWSKPGLPADSAVPCICSPRRNANGRRGAQRDARIFSLAWGNTRPLGPAPSRNDKHGDRDRGPRFSSRRVVGYPRSARFMRVPLGIRSELL